jgi:hypothetical protein
MHWLHTGFTLILLLHLLHGFTLLLPKLQTWP